MREKTNNLGFRPGLTQTGLYSHRSRIEASNFGYKKKRKYTIRVAKTKALISFAVTAKLICGFVFAYAKIRFSHDQGWNTRTCSCTRTYSSTVFPVLSNTQYSAKFLSTSTRTYSSTDAKSPVLMSILRVQLSTFLKIYVFLYFERFFFLGHCWYSVFWSD